LVVAAIAVKPTEIGSVMPHKGKRADTVGPFSILFTLPPGQTQALSRNRSALSRMSYFFFFFFFAMVSSSIVLGPGRRNHPSPTPKPISNRRPRRNRKIAKNAYFSVS